MVHGAVRIRAVCMYRIEQVGYVTEEGDRVCLLRFVVEDSEEPRFTCRCHRVE